MRLMAAITPIAAPVPAPTADAHQQKGGYAAVDFGGAVTHRDLVREKLRVDPAALAEKKRQAQNVRAQDPPPPRDEDKSQEKGQYIDITA